MCIGATCVQLIESLVVALSDSKNSISSDVVDDFNARFRDRVFDGV